MRAKGSRQHKGSMGVFVVFGCFSDLFSLGCCGVWDFCEKVGGGVGGGV